MNHSDFINFEKSTLSNDLWSDFINKIGLSKARLAVRQTLDLQNMQGNTTTLPVLILETCGSALVDSKSIQSYVGLSCEGNSMLLIYSTKQKTFQLLKDN